ncbi:MAG TPA: hypothetical protein VF120_13825, partial [Ktedonobacterales bacterium]
MAGKFVGLVSSKVAVAAMGGLLLAGGVCTVAFAAAGQNTTPMALLSNMHSASSHGKSHDPNNSQGNTPKQHT